MKVKCPECYFVFVVKDSKKYIDCPECKAELNSERLEVVLGEQSVPKKESIFTKALKETENKKK